LGHPGPRKPEQPPTTNTPNPRDQPKTSRGLSRLPPGGRPVPSNIELLFSRIRDINQFGYRTVNLSPQPFGNHMQGKDLFQVRRTEARSDVIPARVLLCRLAGRLHRRQEQADGGR